MATISQNPTIPLTKNKHLLRWVEKMAELTRAGPIHWVDGSQEEYDQLVRRDGRQRHVYQAESGSVAGLLSTPGRTRATWRAWKTGRSSARSRKIPPGRPTTGKIRLRCARS